MGLFTPRKVLTRQQMPLTKQQMTQTASAGACLRVAIPLLFAFGAIFSATVHAQDRSSPGQAPSAYGVDGPFFDGDRLVYPEGAWVPRHELEVERTFRETHPRGAPRAVTPPPTGPVHCVAEYEPMEGILMSWEIPAGSGWDTILKNLALHITTNAASQGAKVYMVVDTTSERTTVQSALTSWGVNMSKVEFVVRITDSIWIRDYGPRYIYQGACRAVVDHDYNRPTRNDDDAFPSYFAPYKKHAFYEHQLVHGGGNYHLDALNRAYATELIWNENPGLSHQQIHDIWEDYQNVDTHIFPPFPTSVDLTQHLDMWMQVMADDKVMISDWPNNVGSTQDVICDNAAVFMANRGYTVYRVPARSISGVHYTYTNVVMCNDLVIIPSYTNATVSPHNAPALAAWQAALPGKTIVQVNAQSIVGASGVFHCIVMHVPRHLGGVNPTVYMLNHRGGEVLTPGNNVDIRWISDDEVGTTNVDILLSTNGGFSYDTLIAAATADDGLFTWNVPDIYTTQARIRVMARNAAMKTGEDQSDSNLTIVGTPLIGDLNCDVKVDLDDVPPFVTALLTPALFNDCNFNAADMNADTFVDALDVAGFVEALLAP